MNYKEIIELVAVLMIFVPVMLLFTVIGIREYKEYKSMKKLT
ncbi:MAG: hypothetical protein NW207_10580 [Cytophagales bacterium]|nr:hypothetical protein [Cytophagales bacterium]